MKEYDFNKVTKNISGRLLLILLFSNMIIGITGHSGIENFASRPGIIQNLYEFYWYFFYDFLVPNMNVDLWM